MPDMTLDDAKDIQKKVLDSKPGIKHYIEMIHDQVMHTHHVETIAGNYRRLDTVKSKDAKRVSRALKQSVNAIVQGSGAYCTNNALIVLVNLFRKYHLRSKVALTVHDSIVVDCAPEEIKVVTKMMHYAMEQLTIPELINIPKNDLEVPDKFSMSDTTFRFPLRGELEIGINYNDDVALDMDELPKYKSPQAYCMYKYFKVQLDELVEFKVKTEEEVKPMYDKLESKKNQFLIE